MAQLSQTSPRKKWKTSFFNEDQKVELVIRLFSDYRSCSHRRTRRGIRGIPGYPVGLKMAGYPSDLNPMVKKMGRKKFMLPKGKEKEVKEREKEREQERKMKIYSVKNMEYTVEMAKN